MRFLIVIWHLIPERQFTNVKNLGETDIVTVIDLDPTAGEGIVVDDDLTFLQHLTNNFRGNWTQAKNIITAEKATPTNKAYYTGSLLEALAYALQYQNGGAAPIYTLYDFALMNTGVAQNAGVTWLDLDGSGGPVELEKAHITLANVILSAPAA